MPSPLARRAGLRQRGVSLLLVSTLSSASIAPAAFAQEAPQAENVAAARSLGLQGIQSADAGDCKTAIEKLSRADALYHAPTILGRLGECQVQVGQIVAGTENLNRVVREQLPSNAPKAFRDAQARAKGVLDAALPKIGRLTVRVEPAESNALVTVDGVVVPPALFGVERPTDPGMHELTFAAPGYLEQHSNVTLTEGGAQDVSVRLEKAPAVGSTIEPATPAPTAVAPVEPTTSTTQGGAGNNKTLAYVALGVGAAGLAVGGIGGVIALGKKNDLTGCSGHDCPSSQRATLDSAKTWATVSTAGFAVGLVGVGVGVVLLLTGRTGNRDAVAASAKLERASGIDLQPWVSGQSAGLRGTF